MPMMKFGKNYPKRGEVFIADLRPASGREIHKVRPVVVLSNNILNRTLPVVLVAPFSSIVPQFVGPDVVKIGSEELEIAKESVILPSHMRALDKDRLVKRVGALSKQKLGELETSIRIVLSI